MFVLLLGRGGVWFPRVNSMRRSVWVSDGVRSLAEGGVWFLHVSCMGGV